MLDINQGLFRHGGYYCVCYSDYKPTGGYDSTAACCTKQ
jgi:hypothetical protein